MAAAEGEETMEETKDSAVRSYEDDSYPQGFLETVCDLQKAGMLQDVVLEVEGRQFPCHRLVLCAASPYFRAMFTGNMAESRQKTVVLQGVDATIFEEILSYIYSGTLHVSPDKVKPLYLAADFLQVNYVKRKCAFYMAMNVDQSTCLDLYKFADAFSIDYVRKRSLQYICYRFCLVDNTDDFYSLSVDQLTEIIGHDWLKASTNDDEEITVWEAVVRWVEHSKEERLHHLPSILPSIRFHKMTSDSLAAILEHPLIREDPVSYAFMRNVVQSLRSKPKSTDTELEMALLFYPCTNEMHYVNPRVGKLVTCCYPELPWRAIAMTVTKDNDVYILAQDLDPGPESSLHVYNHRENRWEQKSSVDGPQFVDRCDDIVDHLVEVDGHLHYLAVVVGLSADDLAIHKKYNPHTNQWQHCSGVNLAKRDYISVSCGPHLYFLAREEMYRYCPEEDQWHRRTPPLTGMDPVLCTAVAMGTEIFCTDREFNKTVVYDTESDSWQQLPGLATRNYLTAANPHLFVLEGQLHILIPVFSIILHDMGSWWIRVLDRSAGQWRDVNLQGTCTIPYDDLYVERSLCYAARIFLPYLNTKRTDPQYRKLDIEFNSYGCTKKKDDDDDDDDD